MSGSKFEWREAPTLDGEQLALQYDLKMGAAFEMYDNGRFADAAAHFEASAELCTRVSKAEAATTACISRRVKALNNAAACHDKLGQLDAAARGYAAAHAHLTKAWAEYMFPSLWDSSYSSMLAHIEKKLGMMPRGALGAHVGQGVDVESVLDVGKQMVLEAVALFKKGEFARALPLLEQALAIHEKHAPGDGVTLATITNNLASTHAELGHEDEARALYTKAMQVSGATEAQRKHVKKKLSAMPALLFRAKGKFLSRRGSAQRAAEGGAAEQASARPPASDD